MQSRKKHQIPLKRLGPIDQLDTCLPAGREQRGEKLKWWKMEKELLFVLVSEVKDLRFYVGFSDDINRRLKEHNGGKTKSTKGYRPWKLFFAEEKESRDEARKRELYLKSGTGKEQIKKKWTQTSQSAE